MRYDCTIVRDWCIWLFFYFGSVMHYVFATQVIIYRFVIPYQDWKPSWLYPEFFNRSFLTATRCLLFFSWVPGTFKTWWGESPPTPPDWFMYLSYGTLGAYSQCPLPPDWNMIYKVYLPKIDRNQSPSPYTASVFYVFPPTFSESFSPAINKYKILVVNLHFETSAIIFYQQNQGIVSTPVDWLLTMWVFSFHTHFNWKLVGLK